MTMTEAKEIYNAAHAAVQALPLYAEYEVAHTLEGRCDEAAQKAWEALRALSVTDPPTVEAEAAWAHYRDLAVQADHAMRSSFRIWQAICDTPEQQAACRALDRLNAIRELEIP